jgi:uncharacterized heparinase superfamily protein
VLGVSAPLSARRLVHLKESGYVIARPRPDLLVVFDVGSPGPDSLPAHSQADCLSLVVGTIAGWAVVDTGTSEYGAGLRRNYERSTAAHNTVEVDRADQTEVWGAFRAGRRARPTIISVGDDGDCITLIAQHDGYRRLHGHPLHRRRLVLRSGEFDITDEVLGHGLHELWSRLHLAEGSVRFEGHSTVNWQSGGSKMIVRGEGIEVARSEYSTTFGQRTAAHHLVQHRTGPLPVEMKWSIVL